MSMQKKIEKTKSNGDLVIILFIKSVNKLIAVVEGTGDSLD